VFDIQIGPEGEVPDESLLRRAVAAVLDDHGATAAELSLTLLGDEEIRALNRAHLDHDWATDVLAFALWEEGEPILGDVYIGVEQAGRQAAEAGVPLTEELVRLAVHGTLHVLGHDHPEEAEARAASPMYRLQERLVRDVLAR
jgi:probable rRNA maturation factor